MMKKCSKRILATAVALLSAMPAFACAKDEPLPDLPAYEKQDFVLFGFWSPYEFTEESYLRYKAAGLNTLMFTNHSVKDWTSDTLHYLGSNATQKSLELCKKVGLNAIPNYGYWYYPAATGQEFGSTPFSEYDLYEEYKDIIVGMHIADEPSLAKIDDFADSVRIEDFKSVYDVPYFVNLFPNYASASTIGAKGYKNYVETYAEKVVSQFESNRLLSVDFYPFQQSTFHSGWLGCYNDIANVAKATNSKKNYYIQTAVSQEFQEELGAAEIGMQLDVAMAFGADWFGFYCYETPRTYTNGAWEDKYPYCMINPDGTPSPLYDAVQSELARITAFSDVYLSYDWVKTVPVQKKGAYANPALRMLGKVDFSETAIKDVTATGDTVVGCFTSDYGEAFMVVNYGNPADGGSSTIEIEFAQGEYAVIYGTDETPKIVKLKKGKTKVSLPTGKGCFVTLL